METVIKKIKEKHDELLDNLNEDQIGIFRGAQIGSGSIRVEDFDYLKQVKKGMAAQKKNLPQSEKMIILEKNFALASLKAAGMIVLTNVDKNGNTQVDGNDIWELNEQMEKTKSFKATRRKNIILFSLLALLPIITGILVGVVMNDPAVAFGIIMIGLIAVAFSSNFIGFELSTEENLKAFDREFGRIALNRIIFSKGKDFEKGSKIKVLFPPCDNSDTMRILLKLKENKNVKIGVCVHESALGLDINSIGKALEMENDPWLVAETEKHIIMYPDSAWGNIPEEKEYLEKIEKLFSIKPYDLFNAQLN